MAVNRQGSVQEPKANPVIRPARKTDACALAVLIDMASEGIASHVWSGMAASDDMPEETLLEVGRARARRGEGGFSYTNAWVVELDEDSDTEIAGMALGYRLDDPYQMPDMAEVPELFHPLIELESLAAGTWYLNVLAVFREYRRQGLGERLMKYVEDEARRLGCLEASLIWAEENEGPGHFYRALGYVERARRPAVAFDGAAHGGDWVLLVKTLQESGDLSG